MSVMCEPSCTYTSRQQCIYECLQLVCSIWTLSLTLTSVTHSLQTTAAAIMFDSDTVRTQMILASSPAMTELTHSVSRDLLERTLIAMLCVVLSLK